MAHPQMFDEGDPYYLRVRELALGLPGADMKVSHGRPAFFTKKVFAYYGASVRSAAGEWVQHHQSVVVLPDSDERAALQQHPHGYVPAYLGAYGWVGIDLDESTDWTEVVELLDASFRQTAGKRLIAELDADA